MPLTGEAIVLRKCLLPHIPSCLSNGISSSADGQDVKIKKDQRDKNSEENYVSDHPPEPVGWTHVTAYSYDSPF